MPTANNKESAFETVVVVFSKLSTADKDIQLFTLSWPELPARCASTLSHWRLVITKATDDRISSFNHDTAENLGLNNWEVVKVSSGTFAYKY